MLAERIGELAALGTALLWTLTYVQFTTAVRIIGPDVLNRLRLTAALGFLLTAHVTLHGTPVPWDAGASQWLWLSLSGIIGFAVSEAFLFRALYHLGAHRTSLVTSLIPVVSTLLAWAFFGETLCPMQCAGMVVTVSGIVLVVSARRQESPAGASGTTWLGVLFALGAVASQSARYLLSVRGMRGGFDVVSTNVIQILAATLAVWLVTLPGNRWRGTLRAVRNRRAAVTTVGGAFTGPFLGVTLSLVALARAPIGIASTLMALVPVFLLPLTWLVFRERIAIRTVLGTMMAVGGVAVLFLF